MADTSVPITPGAGVNVDGFTQSNGDIRQAVVLGDASAANTAKVNTDGTVAVQLYAGGLATGSDGNPTGPEIYTTDPDATLRGTITAASGVAATTLVVSGPQATTSTALAAGTVLTLAINRDASAAVQVSGTWTGQLAFEGSIDGTNFFPLLGGQPGQSWFSTTTTYNGTWRIDTGGYTVLRVRSTAVAWTGTASIILNAAAISSIVTANEPLQTVLTNPTASAAGIFASINAYGGLRVSVEPTPVFFDPFDGALDTTNRWVTAGTTPTVTGGTTSVNASTVASATSRLSSQPSFNSPGLGFEILATVVQLEAAPVTNVYRFWGFASEPTTPAYQGAAAATSTAVTDAVGFELDTAGNLYAVVYASGTNTYRSTAIPTALWRDGAPHRYAIFKRSDIIFFYVEGQEAPVASVSYRPPSVQTLPIRYGAYNNATAPAAYTFTISAVGVQDSTSQNQTLSDATFPWRRAQVSAAGALATRDFSVATAGTSPRTFYNAAVLTAAVTTTEAMASLIPARAGTNGSSGTSMTVTAGRALRLSGWSIAGATSTTAAASVLVRMRISSTTSTTTSSSVIDVLAVQIPTATAGLRQSASQAFPDGIDIPAGWSFGVSIIGTGGTVDVAIHGYEYA